MNSGPSGFYKAPITKVVLLVSGGLSLACASPGLRHHLALNYRSVFEEGQLWRVVASALAFQSSPETVFGLFLLYTFRLFERQLGSRKYAVFVLFSSFVSSALELCVMALVGRRAHRHAAGQGLLDDMDNDDIHTGGWLAGAMQPVSGPYGLVFASFVLFALRVPPLSQVTLFRGLQLSDKHLLYLAGAQLLLSSWMRSLMPGLCGIAAGLLYQANVGGVRSAKIPEWLAAAAASVFAPLLSRPPPSRVGGTGQAAAEAVREGRAGTGGARATEARQAMAAMLQAAAAAAAASTGGGGGGGGFGGGVMGGTMATEPSEEHVVELMSMGFDRDDAERALRQAGNDLALATHFLLESQQ